MHEARKQIFRKGSVEGPPQLRQSYMVLHMGSGEGSWQSSTLSDYYKLVETQRKEMQWESSWQRLESEVTTLSPTLKLTLNSFLATLLAQP